LVGKPSLTGITEGLPVILPQSEANSKPRLRGNQGLWLGEVQQHHILTLLHSFEDDFTTIWRDVEVANVEVGSEMVRAGRGVMRQMSNLSAREPWTK